MREVKPNIYSWSWFSDELGYDFNGHFLVIGRERIVIDPPPMSSADQEEITRIGRPTCILITNRDHVREAETLRNQFSCDLLINEKDAALIDIKADRTYQGGDWLPGGLLAIYVPDNKSPGETAFFLEDGQGILFLGDALVGHPNGQLNLMKPEKYNDVNKAREGIGVLSAYRFDSVLVGDGVSILTGGKKAVEEFLKS